MSEAKSDTSNSAPLNPPVFYGSVVCLVLVLGGAALAPETVGGMFESIQSGIVANASWYYVLVVAVILVSAVVVALTRFGEIKLGPDHAQPEYSLLSWFAMLFAAGMGIGLMFFGVAEPVNHFLAPPHGDGGTIAAAKEAMNLTFFHWGLHAWATYAIVAVILAYFAFRHDLPLTMRSALYPLIGDRIYGPIGTAVDVFAILSTTFGVATSLGFGVEQINSGLNFLFDVPKSVAVQVGLIVLTTGLATVSVVLGLDAGIKRLSEINIFLAVALLIGVLIIGPTVYLLQMFMQNTGNYIGDIIGKTFNLYAYEPTDWLGGWTIFYWGWWISWAPFVGLFIARISRGRTLREFVFGALAAPTLFTLLWMTVFGNSAIALILDQGVVELATAVQMDESVALFKFLENFPGSSVLSIVAIAMVFVFFITSADSGAMVLNMLSSNGRDDTPLPRRIFWMAMIGASALLLLLAGGLPALQTAAIASALPFSLVILVSIWGFVRALGIDHAKRQTLLLTNVGPTGGSQSTDWKLRLRNLLHHPSQEDVRNFIESTVVSAMEQFREELQKQGLDARLEVESPTIAKLSVFHGDEIDFQYSVAGRLHSLPADAIRGDSSHAEDGYFRAEVQLNEGSQDYDVMGWTQSQVLHDILEQYEKHLHFLHVLR
ncbi:MAG: BCCT family transporter [Pseudomonadales bacterium]|nr:BCCT family transporter [Pseudomonadales bacterium]